MVGLSPYVGDKGELLYCPSAVRSPTSINYFENYSEHFNLVKNGGGTGGYTIVGYDGNPYGLLSKTPEIRGVWAGNANFLIGPPTAYSSANYIEIGGGWAGRGRSAPLKTLLYDGTYMSHAGLGHHGGINERGKSTLSCDGSVRFVPRTDW